MNGMLQLPPGLRGFVAADEMAQQKSANQLQQLGGILNLENQMKMQPIQQQLAQTQLQNAQNPAPTKIDLGGEWGLMDNRTGAIVGRIPKSATPDAALKELGANQRHLTPSGSAVLTEEGAMQRHASPSGSTLASNAVSMRGQNLTDARARENLAQGRIPPGYRQTPDGNMVAIPGGPADLKAQADAQKKATGAEDVDIAIGTLRDAYTRLEKGGGITSTENSAIGNVFPSVASSGAGQAAGKLFGTQNQSARNDIAMARPSLLAALMKATGMSAKQMDSNAELKLWLSTATDPTLDVESNRRALDNIEKKYIGNRATPSPAAPARRATDQSGWSIKPIP